jgi:pyrimidine-nucleoside phosphorylase
LDSILFKYRSENNFKNIPSLVISSLLSKKISVGVKNICLDVRYSDFGNFGKSLSEAQKLSANFKEVADLLGIHCRFYFSNNNRLMQPYIGRGESLLALYEYFNDRNNIWPDNHMQDCKKMVEEILKNTIDDNQIKSIVNRNFVENIELQGGSYQSFEKIAEKIKDTHVYEFKAFTSGKLYIDIGKMRSLIVSIQKKHININDEFPDPCGMIFYKNQSDIVSKDDTILTYRVLDVDLLQFKEMLMNIITIED